VLPPPHDFLLCCFCSRRSLLPLPLSLLVPVLVLVLLNPNPIRTPCSLIKTHKHL
jgi:hypothetical protein